MIGSNRELIQRNTAAALEDLHQLKLEYGQMENEEVLLNLELNQSMAEISFYSRYDKASANSLAVIERFKDTAHKNALARHYWLVGQCYAFNGEHDKAYNSLTQSLNLATDGLPDFIELKADVLIALAINTEVQHEGSEESIQYLQNCLQLVSAPQHFIRKANALMGIGNVLVNMLKAEESLQYFHEAAETFEQHYDLGNMASAYSNMGTSYVILKNWEKAEEYLSRSLELRKKFGTPAHLSISYYNLGIVYKEQGKLHQAYEVLNKSREILLTCSTKLDMEMTMKALTEVAEQLGNPLAVV